MRRGNFLFTSESVAEGHPDKVCDRISDAIVDTYLARDPFARVAVETLSTTNRIVLAGEVRGPAEVTRELLEEVARRSVKEIGYEQDGFHWRSMKVENYVHEQSADIAIGVDAAGNKDEGAGDQGIMFGYACQETEALMPAAIYYSHAILKSLAEARHSGSEPGLGPDAKSQVTLEYRDGQPVRATSIVVSTQHREDLDQEASRRMSTTFCRMAGCVRRTSSTSIRPVGSSSAVRTVMLASPAARSSSILMVARLRTAVARFPARTRPRSTDRQPMPRAI
jgi:S-adenosylmethionine synthetase